MNTRQSKPIDYEQLVADICGRAWNARQMTQQDYSVIERSMNAVDGATRIRAMGIVASVEANGIKVLGRDPFVD